MLTLLLVDDEKITRHGICSIVNWSGMGIERVLQAANGIEALEVFHQYKPDILLTDVKMPLMDGITLSRLIRKENPDTRIVFISGYADVDYLKAAVQEQAVDYILKPVDPEELIAAVERAVQEWSSQRERSRQQEDMRYLIKKSLPLYRADFFTRLLSSEVDIDTLREQFTLCDFSFPDTGSFIAALISLQYDWETSGIDAALLAAEAEELLGEFFRERAAGYAYRNSPTLFTLVLFLPDHEMLSPELYRELIAFLTSRLPVTCSIGVGSECIGVYNIGESCQCAETALARQFREGMGQVFWYGGENLSEPPDFPLASSLTDRFCAAVTTHNAELCSGVIQELTELLGTLELININYIYQYCSCFLSIAVTRLCSEKGGISGAQLDLLVRSQAMLSSCKTISDLTQFFQVVFDDLSLMFSRSTQSQSQVISQEVIAYLEKNYSQNVTIQEISQALFITPAYLCRLFKKATSRTINEYLTEMRIQKAKELLKQRQYHLYNIAPMVGYQDIKYFSRIFKERTGMTPSEYAGM